MNIKLTSASVWVYPLAALLLLLSFGSQAASTRPNFLVIVADDMGWSDLGSFGSEIRTPVLDDLAQRGLTMTNFYVGPTCSPTRAMLMTGVDNHLAGVGTMAGVQSANQLGSENYAGQLNNNVVTVAEALKQSGYATLMSGKWHLGTDKSQYPHNRGFERSFVLTKGGASHFNDKVPLYKGISADYLEDGKDVDLPEDFYSSVGYTDKMLEYLHSVDSQKPFFAYLAYTAPHDPLQVPEDWLNAYTGIYDEGPKAIRARRIEALAERGLIPKDLKTWDAPTFPPFLPTHFKPWEERSKQERSLASKPMEIYAAMIELMDAQIQRLLNALEASGQLGNTYVIFISDNGANGTAPLSYPNNTREWFLNFYNQDPEQQGRRGTHTYLGREWASASAAPFKLYKGAIAEGGIRAPLIVIGPSIKENQISKQLAYVTDLPATLYQLAGISPESLALFDSKLKPEGRSLSRNWQEPDFSTSRRFGIELFGHRAVVWDNWKATIMEPPVGNGKWQLYNLADDPGEINDLAEQHPAKLAELQTYYRSYKKRVGIILPKPPVKVSYGDLFTTECDTVCEFTVSLFDMLIGVWQKFSMSSEEE